MQHLSFFLCSLILTITLFITFIIIYFRRINRLKYVILALFALSFSVLLSIVINRYEIIEPLTAACMNAIIFLALTLLTLQSKWDVVGWTGMLVIVVFFAVIGGITATIQMRHIRLFYAALLALPFPTFVVFDARQFVKGASSSVLRFIRG